MSIPDAERKRMLRVALCGPRVIRRLDGIGNRRLDEVADRTPRNCSPRSSTASIRPALAETPGYRAKRLRGT